MNTSQNPETELNLNSSLSRLENEDPLDFDMSPVDKDVAEQEIAACNDHLELGNRSIRHLITEVNVAAVDALFDLATAMKTDDRNYVTALKMAFGVQGGAITLVYQPLYVYRWPSPLLEPFFDRTEGGKYVYDSSTNTFTQVTDDVADVLVNAYRDQIMIKRRGGITFTPFIPNDDTESVIFPFQEIYALIKDNSGANLFIHNSIRKVDVGGSYSIKHCVLLSSGLLGSNSFTGKYANRSHLCPPSCNSLQYALRAPIY